MTRFATALVLATVTFMPLAGCATLTGLSV